jgi:hypothetical protein
VNIDTLTMSDKVNDQSLAIVCCLVADELKANHDHECAVGYIGLGLCKACSTSCASGYRMNFKDFTENTSHVLHAAKSDARTLLNTQCVTLSVCIY